MPKRIGIQYNDHDGNGLVLDLKIEVLRNAEGKITRGLVVGDILEQNKASILIAHLGDFKFNPDLGVALEDIVLDDDYLTFRHRIREHLGKDGMTVEELDFAENRPFKLIANYGK